MPTPPHVALSDAGRSIPEPYACIVVQSAIPCGAEDATGDRPLFTPRRFERTRLTAARRVIDRLRRLPGFLPRTSTSQL
ncbi:MAG TPA: hypothetical protein VE993_09190 [Stellaceae bacterium]|nr:hypothetical protein [Stellaceae bacterium]